MKKIIFNKHSCHDLMIKSVADNKVTIVGYASVYNITDHYNDLIVKGAFATARRNKVKFLWQHDTKKPIGVITYLSEDDYGLKMEAVVNTKVKIGREAVELIKQGAIDGLSIGFYIKNSNFNEIKQRVITEADLIEISIVTFPANHDAKILYTKEEELNIGVMNRLNTRAIDGEAPNIEKEIIAKQIDVLEEKIDVITNFLARPENINIEERECKNAFINYLRKGED